MLDIQVTMHIRLRKAPHKANPFTMQRAYYSLASSGERDSTGGWCSGIMQQTPPHNSQLHGIEKRKKETMEGVLEFLNKTKAECNDATMLRQTKKAFATRSLF